MKKLTSLLLLIAVLLGASACTTTPDGRRVADCDRISAAVGIIVSHGGAELIRSGDVKAADLSLAANALGALEGRPLDAESVRKALAESGTDEETAALVVSGVNAALVAFGPEITTGVDAVPCARKVIAALRAGLLDAVAMSQ